MSRLGADFQSPRLFIDTESHQLSEIFEYSCRYYSADAAFPSLAPCKYEYAMVLADLGLTNRACRYIALARQRSPPSLLPYIDDLEQRLMALNQTGNVKDNHPSDDRWF